ncbi:GDCCVxC domain-containing (seleno)protein [Proteus terrae]|uniref:GDCCVxC domain-containing (seleno)protein n=1 Tax=Proteus terrae TaxID=1574161 RepID=UPI002889759F|nr:GDCCVxC domain-containing (seleno)protein [Proteus terrae]
MSEITCPYCHTLLKPLEGDCCVFCSYGTVTCPPIQEEKSSGKTSCCYQHESK